MPAGLPHNGRQALPAPQNTTKHEATVV